MKILLEASVLQRKKMTGVDYYAKNLFEELVKLKSGHDFFISYFKNDGPLNFANTSKNVKKIPINYFTRRVYNVLFRLHLAPKIDSIIKQDFDLIIFPDFVVWPHKKSSRAVVVVHDTAFIDKAEFVASRLRKFLIKFVPKSINKAELVVTISESTKRSIISHYSVDEAKISVVNPAVNHDIFSPPSEEAKAAVKSKYKIPKKYFLYLGTIEPRKNIINIIKAYKSLEVDLKNNYCLVLAGGQGWLDQEIKTEIELSSKENILVLGYVDQQDMSSLYSGAEAFVFPSLYEGWGMPVLEAMACGTPVITANNSSLPEVSGGAAIMLKKNNTLELANAMKKLVNDKSVSVKYSKLGLDRVKKIRWKEEAWKLLSEIDKLYEVKK